MPRNTHLYENIMFTNKVRLNTIWGERKALRVKRKRVGVNQKNENK